MYIEGRDSMFKVNDVVVHYRDGVSTIVGTTVLDGTEFFVLKAKRVDGVSIYIPIANATQVIRPVMDEANADAIILYMKGIEANFNPNTKQRRDDYKRRLASGNILDIAYLVRHLYLYKTAESLPEKVRFGQVDFDILQSARNMLYDEFCITYNCPEEEIDEFVVKRMEQLK